MINENLAFMGINNRGRGRQRGQPRVRGGSSRPRGSRRRENEQKAETWYWMASTVHKVYKHGVEIIKACTFPPGLLSEEVRFIKILISLFY